MNLFQQALDEWRARTNVSVVTGAVRLNGSLLWQGVSMSGSLEHNKSSSMPYLFPVYSITKTFTAVCLLRLDSETILSINDPVTKWVAGLPVSEEITISRLLDHTSGIPDYGPLRRYHEAVRTTPGSPWSYEKFLDVILTQGLLFDPGTNWSYSNIGYLLLLRVLEQVTGLSFRHCVEKYVVTPLELRNTFVAETIDDWERCVPGYGSEVGTDEKVVDIRYTYHPGWCAPGVAVSTVEDITLFYDKLFSDALLDERHLSLMLQLVRVPVEHTMFITPSYGLGIMADPDGPFGAYYGHSGGGPGYSVFASIIPSTRNGRLSVAVFCNNSLGTEAQDGVTFLCGAARDIL